jgi:hypothetical protein
MPRLSDWMAEAPYRATVLNVLMLSVILAIVGSTTLFAIVGGGALALAALNLVRRATLRTFALGQDLNVYQLALIWIPGALACALAIVGIWMAATTQAGSLPYVLGSMLFAAELAMFTLAGADLKTDAIAFGTVRRAS